MLRGRKSICIFALCAGLAAVAAFGDGPSTRPAVDPTTAVTDPTAPQLTVTMWTVLVIDASNGQVNTDGLVHSVMPDFANDKRFDVSTAAVAMEPSPFANRRGVMIINGMVVRNNGDAAAAPSAATPTTAPSPLTVIRLGGSFDGKFDVSFKSPGATFYGHWPPAEVRSDELLWRDLTVATTSPVAPTTAPADSVFTMLRSADFPYASMAHAGGQAGNGPVTEKFLAVDLGFALPSPLQIKLDADGSLGVTNTGRGTLHDLAFYKSGSRVAAVGDLALPTTRQSATQPTTRMAMTPRPTAIDADWNAVAAKAGLAPVDCDWIGRTIGSYASDENRLTAVYRMDDADAAKLFPMDVTPTPKSVDRFVVVVVRNVDPKAKTVVDELIRQLGDDDWHVRESAYHTLAGYGPAAINKLQGATGDKDAEIAWRAQRLLQMARKQ